MSEIKPTKLINRIVSNLKKKQEIKVEANQASIKDDLPKIIDEISPL